MGGLGETLALLLFVVPYATLGDHPGNRIGGTISPYSTECIMSRFTREVYPVVVVASVGTSTADFGVDTDGSLILNQVVATSINGMNVSSAPAYLQVKNAAGTVYYIPAYTTIA